MSLADIIYGLIAIAMGDLIVKIIICIDKYREETKNKIDNLEKNIKINKKELFNVSHNTNTIASNLPHYSKNSLKLIILAQFGELINYYTNNNINSNINDINRFCILFLDIYIYNQYITFTSCDWCVYCCYNYNKKKEVGTYNSSYLWSFTRYFFGYYI